MELEEQFPLMLFIGCLPRILQLVTGSFEVLPWRAYRTLLPNLSMP